MLSLYKKLLQKNNEIYLKIKARPGANKTRIKEILDNETIKIDLAAPPVKGWANRELAGFLAREFSLDKKNVKIISGAGERVKLVKIIKGGRK